MKEKFAFWMTKFAVGYYEVIIVMHNDDELAKYRAIKRMNELAQELVELDDPKYVDLGMRIAKVNYKALAEMYNSKM